jgi:hypothetical protein
MRFETWFGTMTVRREDSGRFQFSYADDSGMRTLTSVLMNNAEAQKLAQFLEGKSDCDLGEHVPDWDTFVRLHSDGSGHVRCRHCGETGLTSPMKVEQW